MNKRMWIMGLAAGLCVVGVALAGPPSDGLVLHYSFDQDVGAVVTDLSGNGNDGQAVGTEVVTGVAGSGVQLDGRSAFIRTPSSDSLMPEAITLATWVRVAKLPEGMTALFFKRNLGYNDNEGYSLFVMPSGTVRVVLGNGEWQRFMDSKILLNPGHWHHVAMTFSRPDMKVYVDGVLSATGTYDPPLQHNPGADLFVGARDHLAHPMDCFAAASLDDVRIFRRALSEDEIADLAGVETLPRELVLHYTFDRDEGGIVNDASGSGRFGWAHGATWVANGARGGGCRFESNHDYIVADDTGLPSGDAPRTMALWIKLDKLNPDPITSLLTYGRQTWNQLSGIGMDWRVGRANVYFTQHGGVALSQWRMENPGQWHHLAYVYEGKGRYRFYVDGVLGNGMSELRGPIDTVLSGAVILGAAPNGTGPAGGVLDDVRIYARALFEKEIVELAMPEKPAGPVVHYTFDRNEGGIVTDASGHGRTAKMNGATWVADGVQGGAVRFDNNRQAITATDTGLPCGDAPRSIALWMKIDRDYPDGCTGMLGYGTEGYDRRFTGIGFDWRLNRDRVYFSPGGACFLTAHKLPKPGTWMHVAYTYGGNGDHHLYFNGVPSDGMSELRGPVNTTPSGLLLLGGHPNNPGPNGGYLDDVRIYDRVLSAAEIADLALPAVPVGGTRQRSNSEPSNRSWWE